NLGMFICYDGWFPEVARCLMINGCEIMMRPMDPSGIPTVSEREWWISQHTDASEWFVMGAVDVEALRRGRSQIFMNYIAQLRLETYASVYQGKTFFPPHIFPDRNKQSQSETWAIQSATVERLQKQGSLEKPCY